MQKTFIFSAIILTLVSVGLLLPEQKVFARDYSQLNYNTTYTNNNASDYIAQSLGLGDGSSINSILMLLSASTSQPQRVILYQATSSDGSINCNAGYEQSWEFPSQTISGDLMWYFFSTTSSIQLRTDRYYGFTLITTDNHFWVNTAVYNATGTDAYPYGQVYDCGYGNASGGGDLYFKLFKTAYPGSQISFLFPANLANVQDFQSFKLKVTPQIYSNGDLVAVHYTNDLNNWPAQYGVTQILNPLDFVNASSITAVLPKSRDFATGSAWYAQAFYEDRAGVVLDQTPIISFTIVSAKDSNATSSYGGLFDFDNGSTTVVDFGYETQYPDCSVYAGGFFSSSTLQALGCYGESVFMHVVDFVFKPSHNAIEYLKSGGNKFATVFPFNIFFFFDDLAANQLLKSETSTTSSVALTFAFKNTTTSQAIIGPNTLSNAVGSDNKSLYFTDVSYVIWALTGYKILRIFI